MAKSIFINLPVKNLEKTKEFFSNLGYSFNAEFSDETAVSMVISENIYAMMLTEAKFKEFTKKEVVDAQKATEVLIALDCESKEAVDEMMKKVLEAGGKEAREAKDHEFMYERSFEDLDGHIWEIFWMDPKFVQK